MKYRKIINLIPLCLLFLTSGCLKEDFAEKDVSFKVDAGELDFLSGSEITESTIAAGAYPETVNQVIKVTSNESWRVEVISDDPEEDLGWVSLSESEHLNISKVTQNTSLDVTLARNKTKAPRKADILFTRADGSVQKYSFSQRAMVPESRTPVVYSANGKLKDVDNIRGEAADTCIIKVACNTSWKASLVKSETTASATLLNTSGTDDALITLRFKAITAEPDTRTAALVFTAEGCESYTVKFTQIRRK